MHVISGLDQGGAEAMLVRLLRGLSKDHFSQSVVSLTTRGIYGDQVEIGGVPLLTLGMTGYSGAPSALRSLRKAIKVQRPAVVQTWLYHADLLGLVAARTAGDASVAWNVRCAGLGPGDVPRSTLVLIGMLARLSAWPDAVVFNSMAGREAHRAIGYHPRRSEVIPNGFDLEERRFDPIKRAQFRAELRVSDETFVVGMVGRAHRMKDQATFLSAAGRLRGVGRPVRFVLVGLNQSWNNTSLVEDIEQHGLRGHIDLLGLRQDVPRIMSGLDCLVSTSTSEGFPNVIGEAMAAGVPCVATDAGDSRLIVGDTGTIVPVGDVSGVVAGVAQLMALPAGERQDLAERCQRRIGDHFELNDVARRYAEFYEGLIAQRVGSEAAGAFVDHKVPEWPQRFTSFAAGLERKRAKARYRWPRRAALAAVLYVAMFHTPIAWLAGNYLVMRQPAVAADAIVVFSGNGQSDYINDSYQSRARDGARYYKEGYAPLLIISSGIAQTFSEVELMRSLLVSQGVPPTAIRVITQFPASTRENVAIVSEELQRQGITSILFVTAPYHARRGSMIWNKVAPKIQVTTVPVVDTPPSRPQWTAELKQLRAIGYEYLAIAYNRYQGWL